MSNTTLKEKNFFQFTLIELLVVIAIMGILMSLFMPVLSNARNKAKTLSCKNQLRQIGMAFNDYAYNYSVCPAPADTYQFGGHYKNHASWWFGIAYYLGMKQVKYGEPPNPAPKKPNPLICPSASLDTPGMKTDYEKNFYGYGMNRYLPEEPATWIECTRHYPDLKKLRSPSEAILVADGRHWILGGVFNLSHPNDPGQFYAYDIARHDNGRGVNNLYCDGHVEYKDGKKAFKEYVSKKNNYWRDSSQINK